MEGEMKRQETMGKKSHPKTLAPANDQLQSRPATVYEDEVKIWKMKCELGVKGMCMSLGVLEMKQAV